MYDPRIGRFLEEDPIGFDGGDTNLYRYVKNNPTKETDPSGLRDTGWEPPGWAKTTPPFPAAGNVGITRRNFPAAFFNAFGWAATIAQMRAAHPFAAANAPTPIPAARLPVVGPGTNVIGGTQFIAPAVLNPGKFVGTSGCGPSIGLIVACPGSGAVVFHFGTTNSDVKATINQYKWPAGSHAIICGGSSQEGSTLTMSRVIAALQKNNISLDGILATSNCYLGSDGKWYFDPTPGNVGPDP